jgi:hybrid cluster-associated redox disulfide protein
MPKAPSAPAIVASMRVLDVVTLVPQAADVLAQWSLHCSGCAMGGLETLEEGCRAHGYGDEDIACLLADIEEARRAAPARPQDLTVASAAARAIRVLAEQEGKTHPGSPWISSGGLTVTLDEQGAFCMEFCDHPEEGDRVFLNAEEPTVRIFASPLTLGRIGGAAIDFRDGRFKLDLPEDACGCASNVCACKHEKRTEKKEKKE